MKALQLPWEGKSVPHAILDINRTCNITCRGCYNQRAETHKSVGEIDQELRQLLELRRLHTITILGGEPTLHPDLEKIVALSKNLVSKVALVSNGLLFDSTLGRRLKAAGLDIVFFHIDRGQVRPDLDLYPTARQINALRYQKAQAGMEAGLSVGLQIIGYRRLLGDISEAVGFVLNTPGVSHLLVTNYSYVKKFKFIKGAVDTGLSAELNSVRSNHKDELNNQQVQKLLENKAGQPFAYVAAQHDHRQKRWLSYQFCSISKNERVLNYAMSSSLFERFALRATHRLFGRYLFFFKPSPSILKIQLIANGLTGGNARINLTALIKSLLPNHHIASKHLVFQEGPGIQEGRLVYCKDCPDATLKEGRLVPLCLTDKVIG